MTIAPQPGHSGTDRFVVEMEPNIEVTERFVKFAKDMLSSVESMLGEPSYIILAKVETRKRSSDLGEWIPDGHGLPHVGIGGNPLSAISSTQKERLITINGVPLLVMAETFVDSSCDFGIIIDIEENTSSIVEIFKDK